MALGCGALGAAAGWAVPCAPFEKLITRIPFLSSHYTTLNSRRGTVAHSLLWTLDCRVSFASKTKTPQYILCAGFFNHRQKGQIWRPGPCLLPLLVSIAPCLTQEGRLWQREFYCCVSAACRRTVSLLMFCSEKSNCCGLCGVRGQLLSVRYTRSMIPCLRSARHPSPASSTAVEWNREALLFYLSACTGLLCLSVA